MSAASLPELASVAWRPRANERSLRRRGRTWTLSTLAHTVPFVATAALLMAIDVRMAPIALLALVQAWAIPELYARRGALVVAPRARTDPAAERTALGLLGDLVGHDARELHARTGLVLERGRLGVWLVGEAGALLVGERRVHCWCMRVPVNDLPSSDRIAHLLLALREDEEGFATVANLAFSGARWRLRRRLPARMRPALAVARAARTEGGGRPAARGARSRSM